MPRTLADALGPYVTPRSRTRGEAYLRQGRVTIVHAGSATVRVTSQDGTITTYPTVSEDGYLAEWRAMADLLDGHGVVEYDELLDDARYALRLAESAAELILQGAGS